MIGESDALCMRVTSDRSHTMANGDVGYWHPLGEKRPFVKRSFTPKPKVSVNFEELLRMWGSSNACYKHPSIGRLADSLGVLESSLLKLKAIWAAGYKAWAFPMRDGSGRICGIRLRFDNGFKWGVTGSSQGVFMPWSKPDRMAWLPEGPTDTAALTSLNLFPIGRPSCNGGALAIKQTIQRLGIRSVVIISDNDQDKRTPEGRNFNPGYDGAKSLCSVLTVRRCIISLPTKDVREFVSQGGTADDLIDIAQGACWEG